MEEQLVQLVVVVIALQLLVLVVAQILLLLELVVFLVFLFLVVLLVWMVWVVFLPLTYWILISSSVPNDGSLASFTTVLIALLCLTSIRSVKSLSVITQSAGSGMPAVVVISISVSIGTVKFDILLSVSVRKKFPSFSAY